MKPPPYDPAGLLFVGGPLAGSTLDVRDQHGRWPVLYCAAWPAIYTIDDETPPDRLTDRVVYYRPARFLIIGMIREERCYRAEGATLLDLQAAVQMREAAKLAWAISLTTTGGGAE